MIKNIYSFSYMDWALERNIVSIYEGTDSPYPRDGSSIFNT